MKEIKVKLDTEIKFTPVVGERSRTYIFEKSNLTINSVVKLCVRPSGNHRLETSTGEKFIIAAGWIAIKIDAEKWDF
jgi:hypothetical protein